MIEVTKRAGALQVGHSRYGFSANWSSLTSATVCFLPEASMLATGKMAITQVNPYQDTSEAASLSRRGLRFRQTFQLLRRTVVVVGDPDQSGPPRFGFGEVGQLKRLGGLGSKAFGLLCI